MDSPPIPTNTPADPHLVAFLADRDLPCPACTYNLRGLTGNRCPECNRELELQIRLTEPKQGEWVAGVAGASVMAGFHTLLLAYFVSLKIMRQDGPRWAEAWPLLVFSPLGCVSLFLLLKHRRAFCNLSDRARMALGFWICAGAVASAMLFFAIIR